MPRTTIDFGIDLGTTNSTIAVYKDGKVDVYRNNEGFEYTPSAVWVNKHNHLIVGREAKEHLEEDSENAFCEFKRLMSSAERKTFARTGQSMSPEDLSAEVLKELKGHVRQRSNEEVTAAVITVPADFELPQCEATKRAAQSAGLTLIHLLQEPVAAALAYGFESKSDKVFWLVYDFGGGTFDAAIIQVRDGAIEVVNHGGDNFLGGKDIDWAIVEQLLVPALLNQTNLRNFKRGNKEWRAAFAKLKWHAEEAKIALSRKESFDITIKFTTADNFPEPFEFNYELMQSDVAALAEPFIKKTISICKQTLADKRLESGNIEKVLLVGGPTLAPYLRDRLNDPTTGLGICLDWTVDPMTVVARGASIYAHTQRMPTDQDDLDLQLENGLFVVSFPDWKFTGSDIEPIIAGKVSAPAGSALDGLSIEFINETAVPRWQSGKLPLQNGGFMTTLWADKKSTNTFTVVLSDKIGRELKVVTDPAPLTYSVGLTFTDPPLTHSVGLALANNEFMVFFEKGTPLPAHKKGDTLKTTLPVHKGQKGDLIRILVLEGESPRADRNRKISVFEIPSDKVKMDVPAGSDVEVTINIDRSRLIKTNAYIPILDEEFDDVISMEADTVKFDPKAFGEELDKEKKRLANLKDQANATSDEKAKEVLQRIDQEELVQQADAAFAASSDDPDDAKKCRNRLLDLRRELDNMEDALEWPNLVQEAEKLIASGNEIAQQHGNAEEKRILQAEEAQLRVVLKTRDADLLSHQIESYRMAIFRILQRTGILQVIYFQNLCDRKAEMRDQTQAQQLMSEGLRAMNTNDAEKLQAINRQLAELLPNPPPQPDISTVIRANK
ncbi:MAG: Hsp70 family protein [Anaerolineaceae bacterium]